MRQNLSKNILIVKFHAGMFTHVFFVFDVLMGYHPGQNM